MFKEMRNEARINFTIQTDSSLYIGSGNQVQMDPSHPDMSFIRTFINGEPSVFIPGSSLKGVLRSRCEQIMKMLGAAPCLSTDKDSNCGNQLERRKKELASGTQRYEAHCPTCRMFGSTLLGGRFRFSDAHPVETPITGVRTGVAINRITGAVQHGAVYNYEVVEEGRFSCEVTINNYELYQLKVFLFALQDMDDGYVGLGGATTRGSGKVRVTDVTLSLRDYRPEESAMCLLGYQDKDRGGDVAFVPKGYFQEASVKGLETVQQLLENVNVPKVGVS